MNPRTTIDKVILLLAGTVAVTMVLIVVGAVILKIVRPEADTRGAGTFIGQTLTTIVSSLIGFVGGRAAGRLEVNGVPK
ncbi:MAG TPA: hypothetical protein VFQ43_14565 [Nitrososphaera sp.]|nr:hypothetical protein [Nitrososphaera sp.]